MQKNRLIAMPEKRNLIKRNPTLSITAIAVLILTLLLILHEATAFPILPAQFYGNVIFDGKKADTGTIITAYDSQGALCGRFAIEKRAEYIISCEGDDKDTLQDEGASENEEITFYIDDNLAIISETSNIARWHKGMFQKVDISASSAYKDTYTNKNNPDDISTSSAYTAISSIREEFPAALLAKKSSMIAAINKTSIEKLGILLSQKTTKIFFFAIIIVIILLLLLTALAIFLIKKNKIAILYNFLRLRHAISRILHIVKRILARAKRGKK